MTGAAQRKSVPETQAPVWTSVWVTGAGQALWDAPWQPSWSLWQPPILKDSYWLAVTVPNATGASLRCQVFITRPSGRETKIMWKIYVLYIKCIILPSICLLCILMLIRAQNANIKLLKSMWSVICVLCWVELHDIYSRNNISITIWLSLIIR